MTNLTAVIPSFLDQAFFDKVVRQMEKDANAKVLNFDIKPAMKPGENFASAVFRCSITFTSKFSKGDKTISVIIKTKPVLGPDMAVYAEIIEKSPFFRNESVMYNKILPDIHALLSSVGDKDILSPKLIYQSNEPSDVIILEDACVDGYSVIDKPPEEFEVSTRIVERLAKFHAANFYLISEHKLDPSEFNHCVFENPATSDMLFGRSLEGFANVVIGWKGFEKFVPHLDVFKTSYLGKLLKSYKPNRSENGYNVLNHADFHVRNALFKKSADGKVQDFCFVDFQICDYATPAIDLIYSMYYFLSAENRMKRRGEFICSYYNQFVTSLKQFGYMRAPPSLIDLHVELLKNGSLEVLLAVCNSIVFYYDLTTLTAEDFDGGEGTKKFFQRVYSVPEFKTILEHELPRFLHNGFI